MKDPTGEILTAYVTALASITYNSKTWAVYKETPPRGKQNYIYLSNIILRDVSDKSHSIFQGDILVQISVKKDKYCKLIANSLSSSVIQAIANTSLSMTTFNQIISNIASEVNMGEEENQHNYVKTITFTFQTQEK